MKRLFFTATLVVSLGGLFVHAESLPGLTLPEVLARMQDAQHAIQTIQFHFTETRGQGPTADRVEGLISFKRPHQLRMEQTHPEKQTLWSDGQHLWLYSPSEGQELTGPWKLWLARSGFPVPLLGFISDFQPDAWTTRYTILFGGYDDHLYQLIFKPKSSDDLPMKIWVSDSTFLPVRGQLQSPTMPVTVLFKDLHMNPTIDEHYFTPTVPTGTAVVPLPS